MMSDLMNKEQAIKALDEGKTLTHEHFTKSEWVRGIGAGMYEFEDGIKCSAQEFWAYRNDFNDTWRELLSEGE
ncbi:hypothetical protein NVP1123O_04 [Vibrio phage 1.123.O._10N.286.48.F3]|nr:hypothetical protein NVP1123O_04 [Vibrio phage 1.123.O._10N.286.48.F3]